VCAGEGKTAAIHVAATALVAAVQSITLTATPSIFGLQHTRCGPQKENKPANTRIHTRRKENTNTHAEEGAAIDTVLCLKVTVQQNKDNKIRITK
jgi:hypothetical protein